MFKRNIYISNNFIIFKKMANAATNAILEDKHTSYKRLLFEKNNSPIIYMSINPLAESHILVGFKNNSPGFVCLLFPETNIVAIAPWSSVAPNVNSSILLKNDLFLG